MRFPRLTRHWAVGSLTLLLAACSNLPMDSASIQTEDAPPLATQATPADTSGWASERQRLVKAFSQLDEVSALEREDGALLVRFPAADGFAADSSTLAGPLKQLLQSAVPLLADVAHTEIKVLGHTDSVGSETYNLQLSIRRAEAVLGFLRDQGIPLTRLIADGRGETEPIADNREPSGRALNRRVELVLRPFS